MGEETLFKTSRQRDAWGAIRGYVYQVDLTVLRWLELQKSESLVLECGEDIDHVHPLMPESWDEGRLLEQVKVRKGLTLPSYEAREALASFSEHRANNPQSRLRFRFLTTALPGDERPPIPGLGGRSGICAWEAIRSDSLGEDEAEDLAAAILNFLKSRRRPPLVSEQTWSHFHCFTMQADPPEMLAYIRDFEWATGAPQPEDLAERVRKELFESGKANSEDESIRKQEHLVVYVFRLLSEPDEKRLTFADLQRELDVQQLDHEELALQRGFRELRGWIAREMSGLREEMGGLREEVGRGFAKVHSRIDEVTTDLQIREHSKSKGNPNLPEVTRILSNASAALLSWPQEIGGRWIDQPVLTELEDLVASAESTFAVLAGPPGSGKSAILARLGGLLRQRGTALLAIKADLLSRNLKSVADFETELGLDEPLTDFLAVLAKERPVVLLIDQLDALGELMDQHTERLSVLLSCINRLRDTANVHIIASCREFELRHDTRLARLGGHEVRVGPFRWADVKELLDARGVATESWPEDAKEILRVAQNLSLFVRHFADGDSVFESYHSMLEALWEKIRAEHGGAGLVACERIAAAVADEEELWLPISRFDDIREQIGRLVGTSILATQSGNRKVGFSHQMLFEFVRARMFTRSEYSLAAYVIRRQDALFVRPVLWSALHYLRSVDRSTYAREFRSLWENQVRPHVRGLLLTFLGQLESPDTLEVRWVVPLLDHTLSCQRALRAVEGSPGWFEVLKGRLPMLMTQSEGSAWSCVGVLRAAWTLDEPSVVQLINDHWLPDANFNDQVLSTLRDLSTCSDQTVGIVERIIARTPVSRSYVEHVAENISRSSPDLAPRVVAAQLSAELARAHHQPVKDPKQPPGLSSETERAFHRLAVRDARLAPFKKVLCDNTAWYHLGGVAERAPEAFLDSVWPVFERIYRILAAEKGRGKCYRSSVAFELNDDYEEVGRTLPIVHALRVAVGELAKQRPERFRSFIPEKAQSDLMTIHCLLCRGLEVAPKIFASEILDYLLKDPRRLAIGSRSDQHARTRALISSTAPHWEAGSALAVENAIRAWDMSTIDQTMDAPQRWDARKWNRQHRLRLLRAFPANCLSEEGQRQLREEERALPGTTNYDSRVEVAGAIGSPVSAAQMAKATDQHILHFFDKLHDGTRWTHSKSSLRGGSVQAAREFTEFAKQEPRRALRLIRKFQAGRQERPAGAALYGLAKERKVNAETIVKHVHELHGKGFVSRDFRMDVASALDEVSQQRDGLDQMSCDLLESWIEAQPTGADAEDSQQTRTGPHDSLLWGSGLVHSPGGNYQYLRALTNGLLSRKPPTFDLWLSALERHVGRPEQSEVWVALAGLHLEWLRGVSDRSRVVAFLGELFRVHPKALASWGGVRLLGSSHEWLPERTLHEWMLTWQKGTWPKGPQAAGELGMLRRATTPGDGWCQSLVQSVVDGSLGDAKTLAGLRLGIAYTAVELWCCPQYRATCGAVIRELMPAADEELAATLVRTFHMPEKCPVDSETEEMLLILSKHPLVLAEFGRGYMVAHLSDYLAAGVKPALIADVLVALVEEAGAKIGNIQTPWSGAAGELIDLSLTLQRYPETRSEGLDAFEGLLEFGAYEAAKVLREIDRRL